MLRNILATAAAGVLLPITSSAAQVPCGRAADSAMGSGWVAYRGNQNQEAVRLFERALRHCPEHLDARVGLGFALLRLGRTNRADSQFQAVLSRNPSYSDAWEGHARAALRAGDTATAVKALDRALKLAPNNPDLHALRDRVPAEWRRRRAVRPPRPATLQVVARTRGRRFEIRSGPGWEPFYVQGVNLGAALPGKHPSEFPPDSATYAGWLDTLAHMNANTVRVYTILPPTFYRALRGWNRTRPDRPLWLMHGVWTELPPGDDFDDPQWKGEFQAEMRRVVNLLHGAANIPPRPGHASGNYDADVSSWVLGYILGREWEPFAVKAFAAGKPDRGYAGRYLMVRQGPAMDVWLAEQCDLMLRYEVEAYNAIRPIAYTNWPTLDPLHHPTEASTAEEAIWRGRSGRTSDSKKLEYENDALGIDPNLVVPTPANPAGWFASYHAYPYYPDFMILDPGYRRARSSEGPSTYFGYLRELIEHHGAIPTIIAEYGVPSSRGIAHLHPGGWSHGGHDETAMAAIDARLTREIEEAGAAGAILFAWMDEWFKKNWIVIDYEIPLENTRLWHNVMDAEQNYGILGQYAGSGHNTPRLGGDPSRWRSLPMLQGGPSTSGLRAVRAGSDESFLYLALELPAGSYPWDTAGIRLAIDSYRPRVGQHRIPGLELSSELGFEFLIDIESPRSARMMVIPEYNRHDSRIDRHTGDDLGRFSRRPVLTRNRDDGKFDSMFVITNRARFGRDGTFFPAQGYDRGRLRYGRETENTLSDWYFDRQSGMLQLRVAWDLLNVTDPSTRTLLHDESPEGDLGTTTAQDFHVGAVLYRKRVPQRVLSALPPLVNKAWQAEQFRPWRWSGWTEPRSHARLKPVYDSIRRLWRAVPSAAQARPVRRAPSN